MSETSVVSKPAARLPSTVISLGLVSLFTDMSSEAIFPLLPAFLVGLGASSAFIGLVEGAAEVISNSLKYLTGKVVDRRGRLKPLILAGYGVSTLVRPLAAFALAPWHVLLVRSADRVGKGVRTTPRDALIAQATDSSMRARAYGFHRAMDHAGAAAGTLLASLVLWALGTSSAASASGVDAMRKVFLVAAIPGLFAMVTLARTAEPRMAVSHSRSPDDKAAMSPALRRLLVALTMFALANATDAFLIVKATKLGAAPALAPLLWLLLHVVKASTATSGGTLADRFGKRNALVLGWIVYAVIWGSIGFAGSLGALFLLTAVYGVSHGLVEGAERGLIADLAHGSKRGAAFGAYNLLIGMAALVSSTAFGAVFDRFGSVAAFCGSACFALFAAILLYVLLPAHCRLETK